MSFLMAYHMNKKYHQNLCYLDINYNNHMSRDQSILSDLDKSHQDIVKFGNEFIVFITGKGIIVIQTKKNSVHTSYL